MEAITEPYVESENPQEEEEVDTKVKPVDGRGRSPASLANLKPRAKKAPEEPKVRYAKKHQQETLIYDMAEPVAPSKKSAPPEPTKKKRRTKVVVVEQDSSDDESDQDIQVVVAKKQKKKKPVAPTPKRPPTPAPTQREESDDELEVKAPKPIIKPVPIPSISFF